MMKNIAIFASGSGTNAENITKYFKNSPYISVKVIISNKSNAFVLQRAKNLNIKSEVITKEDLKNEKFMLSLIKQYDIDYIILAGFLLKIPDFITNRYSHRIINIHPALLPKYGGKGMYGDNVHRAVFDNKDQESGITIHFCNENYDEGDIIYQAKCTVLPTDTYKDIANKVHQLEYTFFPKVIEKVILDNDIKS